MIMWFPLIPLSIFVIVASSFGFTIDNASPKCPPAKELKPCTCSVTEDKEVKVVCQNIIDGTTLNNTFSKHPNWKIEKLHFDHCIVDYLPSSVLRHDSLKRINVSSSTLGSLFDKTSITAPDVDIWLYDVKLVRGLEWELFKNTSIAGLATFNVNIRHFGKDFKQYMPPSIKNFWIQNSKTVRISEQAFQRMENVEVFSLTGGSLRRISRDMFPRPWNVMLFGISEQKITKLPEDIFDDLPNILAVNLQKNFLTEIDEKVFNKGVPKYFLKDNPIDCSCDVKWITTSKVMFDGTCSDDTFKGRELEDLTKEDFSFCRGSLMLKSPRMRNPTQ